MTDDQGDPLTDNIDAPSEATVTITPSKPIVIVSVVGETADGCTEPTTITLISDTLTPMKSFSPNGDGLRDCWGIINSSILDGCTVYVFDTRGTNVFKGTSPFIDDCIWEGDFNGKNVPEGVYYFAMKCDDASDNQSGSILLAR